ncbi:hypothetical protein AURDEDRAFT_186042 [Auricularia subglabra TFB-10046 SS5]|nr:hypothetical protein AURDEDRAFT_186042 [Auricularia subglabra TFB-10046 SS5]
MPSLPPEVWALVFEQAYLTPWSRMATLRDACLVCRQWAALAAPWLYRHVRIRRGLPLRQRRDAFYTICEYRRDLARCVYSLDLACAWCPAAYATQPAWARSWTHVFSICRELRMAEIHHAGLTQPQPEHEFHKVLATLMSGLPNLQHLRYLTLDLFPPHHVFWPPLPVGLDYDNVFQPLVRLPSLSTLRVGIIDPRQHGNFLRPLSAAVRGACTIKDFHLALQCCGPVSQECSLLVANATSLRIAQSSRKVPLNIWRLPANLCDLTFQYYVGLFGDPTDIPALPTLRSLCIQLARGIQAHHVRGLQTVVTSLTQGTDLDRLTLQAGYDTSTRALQIEGKPFIDSLPQTLEVFNATKLIVSREVLRSLLRRFQRLRGLSVSLLYKADFEQLDWDTLLSARALECLELHGWPHGDAREVRLFEETAVRWMRKLPTLRHAKINGSGWVSLERPDQVRARNERASLLKPWNSDQHLNYSVQTVVPLCPMHPPTLRNVRLRYDALRYKLFIQAHVGPSTPDDAYVVLRAVIAGYLPEYPHRLCRDDAAYLRVGDIFVYQEGGKADITRWTDSIRGATPSRNIRGFLCYILPATSSQPPWCKKTTKIVNKHNPRDAWHLVAYDLEDEDFCTSLRTVSEVQELSVVLKTAKLEAAADYVPAVSSTSPEPASTYTGFTRSGASPEAHRRSTSGPGLEARRLRLPIRCRTSECASAVPFEATSTSPDTPIPHTGQSSLFTTKPQLPAQDLRACTRAVLLRLTRDLLEQDLPAPVVVRMRHWHDNEMLARFTGP